MALMLARSVRLVARVVCGILNYGIAILVYAIVAGLVARLLVGAFGAQRERVAA